MFRRPIKEINAEFSAEDKYLESIQRTVRESCVAAGMSRKDVSAVLLATEEAATNVIRHAYLYEKGTIRLRIVTYRKLVVFSLIDYGRSFQPNASGTLDLKRLVESGRKGGLGFYMIQKIMDSVEYMSSAGRNELRMIKRIGGRSSAERPLLRRAFTLRVKFSLWTFFIVSVIGAGAFYYMNRQTSRGLYDHLDATVYSLAETIADQAAGYITRSRSDVEFAELVFSYRRANPDLLQLVVLTNSKGMVIAHSDDSRNIRKPYQTPDSVDQRLEGRPQRYRVDGKQVNYLMMPIKWGGTRIGMAHIVYSSESIAEKFSEAQRRAIVVTLVLLLFGVLGIYVLSSYFVEPIVKITERVRRFASGDLESELPLEGAEEFFEISKALNEMMTRLSQDRKNIVAREKMAKEIEVASQIQQTLMPHRLPQPPGLELDAFYRAASVVSGDLYDVFEVGRDRYCLVVADVSGKGVPASLVMSMLRTVIQINSASAVSAKDTLIKVNDYLKKNIPSGMFITVMLVVYDAAARTIDLISAGHNPMLFYSAGTGMIRRVNPSGMPLGVPMTLGAGFEDSLEEITLKMEDGDLFLVYTDGITEATDREGRQFGLQRLVDFLTSLIARDSHDEVSSISRAIVSELDEFAGFAGQNDDITFIVARAGSGLGSDGRSESVTDTQFLAPDASGGDGSRKGR